MAHRSTPESRRAFMVNWFGSAALIVGLAALILSPVMIGLAIAIGGMSTGLLALTAGFIVSLALGMGFAIAVDIENNR